jgi:hypothetical protein
VDPAAPPLLFGERVERVDLPGAQHAGRLEVLEAALTD